MDRLDFRDSCIARTDHDNDGRCLVTWVEDGFATDSTCFGWIAGDILFVPSTERQKARTTSRMASRRVPAAGTASIPVSPPCSAFLALRSQCSASAVAHEHQDVRRHRRAALPPRPRWRDGDEQLLPDVR